MLDRELQKRLYLTYRYSTKANEDNQRFLCERNGVPDIVDDVCLWFRSWLRDYIRKMQMSKVEDSNIGIGKEDINIASKDKLFFKEAAINIRLILTNKTNGELQYRAEKNNFSNGKLNLCKINGYFKVNLKSIGSSVDNSTALFAHELLHAYEDWCRYSGGRENFVNNLIKYGANTNTAKNDIFAEIDERKLSIIIYMLTPAEVRAYTAQLVKEIESEVRFCKSSAEAFDVVRKTTVWYNYKTIESWVDNICNRRFKCSESDIEYWWSENAGYKMTFEQICKEIKKMSKKAIVSLTKNVSKKIGELALANKTWMYLRDSNDRIDIG